MFISSLVAIAADANAQNVTLVVKAVPMYQVFKQLEKQTGYLFFYKGKMLGQNTPITTSINNMPLKGALDKIFTDIPFTYEIVEETIVVKEKTAVKKNIEEKRNKQKIIGTVTNEKGEPLTGVSVKLKGTDIVVSTDSKGIFFIEVPDGEVILQFSYVGYETFEQVVSENTRITIKLKESTNQLQSVEIVSTGYQTLPKERATGSFVQIDNTLLNRRVSTNILDRLDGITSGLIFNKISGPSGLAPTNEKLGISIRGRVTIDDKVSADPLIVLDNFPYEGDINNINPNDIESVTVLRDAAAASIWGARSGNGVIVITTKRGKFNQPLKIELNSNLTVGSKPNLKYSRNFIGSSEFVDAETYLFNQGQYTPNLNDNNFYPVISPIVELLAKQKADPSNAAITAQINAFRNIDIRDQAAEYFYQKSLKQQYSLSMRGGSMKALYSLSLGYDNNKDAVVGAGSNRLTINATNSYHPIKKLELTGSIIYTKNSNKFGYNYTSPYPYLSLADNYGNPLAVPYGNRSSYLENAQSLGFLDWKYRPLQERNLNDNTSKTNNILLRGVAKYSFTDFLNAEVQYQYETETGRDRGFRSPESYEARNNINKYSQRDINGIFTYPFPKGGILYISDRTLSSNNFRAQLNFNKEFGKKHSVSAIAGAELREIVNENTTRILYGYNDNFGTAPANLNYNVAYPINPSALGSITLPSPLGNLTGLTNRYISYYANGAYTLLNRYTFSLSGRKDGANIFGVKTNDKVTPLWSSGVAYEISKEPFYDFSLIPYLKLRASYGYNGNVYNASAYLTASYDISPLTGLPIANITSAPNSELRWEKIRNKNLAIDFSSKNNRINGSFEIYEKLGKDLIEDALLPPSTGFNSYKGNAATVKNKGVDLTLNSVNLKGEFSWNTTLLFSYNKDEVISYDTKYTSQYLTSNQSATAGPARYGLYIKEGKSLFGVYSFKSAGLDPLNGDPRGYLNGQISKDYLNIITKSSSEDIIYHGSSRPTHFGALRNTFLYRGFSVSANIVYKFNYYFKLKSTPLIYANVIASGSMNEDFNRRWQKPGDEIATNVPSVIYDQNLNRNAFYQSSEALVEKGDHIRLQDISVSYDFNKLILKKLPFSSLQIYSYVNNLGILWRANKHGIDPDVSEYNYLGYNLYPNPTTISFGIRITFK